MRTKTEKRIFRISPGHAKLLLCFLVIVIAGVDHLLPANISVATLYFAVIVLAGLTNSAKWLWSCALICILLTFGGIGLGPTPIGGQLTWVDWLNRTMTAVALAVAAVPLQLRLRTVAALERSIAEQQQTERALQESHHLLEKRVEERTSALGVVVDELQTENASRIKVEAELRESEESLRELSLELLRAQDEERRHIGQELHDGLGQCLAGLKLNLHFVGQAIPASARQHFAESLELTEDAISQVRTLSHLMYPPMLAQMGLESAIPWFVRGFQQRSGIDTALEMPQYLGRLPEDLELTLFRILQESLTNIHRHSGSRSAYVGLKIADGAVVLQIKDNGRGIRDETIGVGLRSMQERSKQLKGKLELASGPEGTTVTAALPYRIAAAAAS
jgi:signal transduction histidine kinase